MTEEKPYKEQKKRVSRAAGSPQVKVEISQFDIDTAIPRDSGHCMIADAIKRQVPEAASVSVDLQTIRWTDREKGLRYVYLTPQIAQVALVQFDQGIAVEPFSFRVRKAQVIRANKNKSLPKSARRGDVPKKATLVRGNPERGEVPEVVGGSAPPLAALSNSARVKGRRRAFGLRGLGR